MEWLAADPLTDRPLADRLPPQRPRWGEVGAASGDEGGRGGTGSRREKEKRFGDDGRPHTRDEFVAHFGGTSRAVV